MPVGQRRGWRKNGRRVPSKTGGLPCRLVGCLALWLARWMARGPWRLARAVFRGRAGVRGPQHNRTVGKENEGANEGVDCRLAPSSYYNFFLPRPVWCANVDTTPIGAGFALPRLKPLSARHHCPIIFFGLNLQPVQPVMALCFAITPVVGPHFTTGTTGYGSLLCNCIGCGPSPHNRCNRHGG